MRTGLDLALPMKRESEKWQILIFAFCCLIKEALRVSRAKGVAMQLSIKNVMKNLINEVSASRLWPARERKLLARSS
jgi:hypothetical protein